MNTGTQCTLTVNGKPERGEYTGFSEITKKHHFSMYNGAVVRLDSLNGVKMEFKKEWNEADFKAVQKAITARFKGKNIITHHNPEGIILDSYKAIDSCFGLAYTSSSMWAMYSICNTEVKYDADFKYEFFVVDEAGRVWAALWDKDENEKYIQL